MHNPAAPSNLGVAQNLAVVKDEISDWQVGGRLLCGKLAGASRIDDTHDFVSPDPVRVG